MRTTFILMAAAVCGITLGCNEQSGPRGGSAVRGKVTFKNAPVAGAKVVFSNGKDTGALIDGPNAITDEAGEYAVVGVPPGTYKVIVYKLVPVKGAVLPPDMDLVQIEASGMGSHALPKKYASNASTTLTAEVGSGSNNDVNFDLK